jgi:hypothetical protein
VDWKTGNHSRPPAHPPLSQTGIPLTIKYTDKKSEKKKRED